MKKRQITRKEAREKYGIIVKRFHDYKYYLLENGDVIDSDGDIRYIAPKITKKKLLNALNRIDELACVAVEDNDNGEAEKLERDYNLVFNFIKESKIK